MTAPQMIPMRSPLFTRRCDKPVEATHVGVLVELGCSRDHKLDEETALVTIPIFVLGVADLLVDRSPPAVAPLVVA